MIVIRLQIGIWVVGEKGREKGKDGDTRTEGEMERERERQRETDCMAITQRRYGKCV